MSRTDIRPDNIVRQRPPVTAPALSPMMQRVARQAAQSRLATPQMPLPSVTGQMPPQQPQEADTGLMGALRAPLMSPRGQAISQAALAGLEAGGYTTMPTTLGQAIGKMGQAALQGYAAGTQAEAAQRKAALDEAKISSDLNRPKFQVVGKKLFKIDPDGTYTEITGDGTTQEPPKIKSEAGRYLLPDGSIGNVVISEDGNLYEMGNVVRGQEIDPKKSQVIDQFTTLSYKDLEAYKKENIKSPERTLQIIDRLATQIEGGASGWVDRQKSAISRKIKEFTQKNPEFSDEELNTALQQGTLTQLIGSARLELFGPGVMTEFEQAMARSILAGDFDRLTVDAAVNRLYQFRESFLPNYLSSVEFYNRQPVAVSQGMSMTPFTKKDGFNWDKYISKKTPSGAPKASGTNTTSGGSTWKVVP